MKILILSPFGATEPYPEENIGKVARGDVSFEVDCLKDVFPLPYNTYRYNVMKCVDGAVELIGVPVPDPRIVAFKMAEMMVDLGRKARPFLRD